MDDDARVVFAVWWACSLLFVLPIAILYLASPLKQSGLAFRLFTKSAPVFGMALSLLLGIAVGLAQRTIYSDLFVVVLLCCGAGDVFLCFADDAAERKQRQKQAFLWRAGGVLAFACAHIVLIVAFSLSPRLSMGLDNGPLPPLGILYAIPFMLLYKIAIVVCVWTRKLSPGELIGIGVYSALLQSACWRASVCIHHNSTVQYLSAQIVAFAGLVLFALSDFGILIDTYVRPSRHAKYWVMPLYWIGTSALYFSSFLFRGSTQVAAV
jgi:hypothetical protein